MTITYPRGQVLLITVLVLSVAVTIALSLIGRSVSDVSMSRNLEESARAFSAAEAGIEEALQTNTQRTNDSYGGAGYTSNIAVIGLSTGVYTLPTISVGQADTVWLVYHDVSTNAIDFSNYYGQGKPSSSLDICWNHVTPVPALEVAIYYLSGVNYLVNRGVYDPDSASRPAPANHFSNVTEINNVNGCGGMTNAYRQTVSIPTGAGITPLFMRIRPYYGNATVTISPFGGNILPMQGFEVSSVGCTQITADGCTEGGVTRKIVVRRQYPGAATIFDYSIYSQGSLVH
jgi:hypothetical protein